MSCLSQRIPQLHASPIREILAVIQQPGMVSFAGGLPAPESFPALSLADVPRAWLQYGATEGEASLRAQICSEVRALGIDCEPSQILVLSGSQQGIDLVAKLMIDAGTNVAIENPSYLAALQAFRFFGAQFSTLAREDPLACLSCNPRPTLCYTIPTFQNPTGYCYSTDERRALADACQQQEVLLFEDDPYRDLVYDTCERRPVCSLMTKGSWVYQGSFSKTLAPGLRLGFLVASNDILPHLVRLKQAADLHSNRLSQYLVLQALQDPGRSARAAALQQHYREKRDIFQSALETQLGTLASWDCPRGGLFFWVRLLEQVDTQALLTQAIHCDLAFMPGEPFFHAPSGDASYLRLNFSHATPTQMHEGLGKLRKLLDEGRINA